MSTDEVSEMLNKISNKYTNDADMKHLNQIYDIGIMMANRKFNKHKLANKLSEIIDKYTYHPINDIREHKKKQLMTALQQGIDDGNSDDYRMAYDNAGKYKYNDKSSLIIRARIDAILDMN